MNENKLLENIKTYVSNLLLPLEEHYYHHYEHALDVMNRCVYIWKHENISEEELEMLSIAALFHDTWFIVQYDSNEIIWSNIAKNYLKTIMYTDTKINSIIQLILATDPWYKSPKNILEKIIKDADVDNLWRDDFFDKTIKLKKEIEIIKNIKINEHDWYHSILDLLNSHKFLTKTWREERHDKLEENKIKLKELIIEIDKADFKNYSIEL